MGVTEKLYALAEDRARRADKEHAPNTSNTMAMHLDHEARAYLKAAQGYVPYQFSGIEVEAPAAVEYTTRSERLVRRWARVGLFVAACLLGYVFAVVVFAL